MKQLLEAGEVINTHGIRGEVKVRPWCDSLSDLLRLKTVYLAGNPVRVLSSRAHKGFALMLLEGIDTIEKAEAIKNSVLFLNRADVSLPEGAVFLQDIIGFSVYDERTDRTVGQISDTLSLPRGDLLIVQGEEEYMIPSVPEFIKEIDFDRRTVRIRTIEGMLNEI